MENLPEFLIWQLDPSFKHHDRAYKQSRAFCHWARMAGGGIFERTGYSVSAKLIEGTNINRGQQFQENYEYFIDWPTPEQKKHDFLIFNQAVDHMISTLDMDDEEYSQSLPQLFEILNNSNLFKILSSKENPGHGKVISDHILKVSKLVKTDGLSIEDKLVLRIVSPFHDLGKAFNTKKDKLQYHALISSVIMREFLINSEGLIKKEIEELDSEIDYQDFSLKVTEIIRLHHIFEKFDVGIFKLTKIAEIISENEVCLILLASLTFADIKSFATGKNSERYLGFLDAGIQTFLALLEITKVKDLEGAKALINCASEIISNQ